MPIDFPPELALKEFLGATTRHTRRIEIYESDGETRWEKDQELRLKGGSVSVDYDRDERRMLDGLVLANDDGVLVNAPEEFWYDKIIKVFRGVVINQPKRVPKVIVISDPAGDLTLAPAFRDALESVGFTNVTVNTLASTWEHIMGFDIIVGLGASSTTQIALLKKAYEEGKSLFVQDADAGAWIASQFATEAASISSGSTVTPLGTSPHPVSKGWAPFSYVNPGSRRNAARNPQAEGRSGYTVPLFGRHPLGTGEAGYLLNGTGTSTASTNLVINPSVETATTGYVGSRCTLTRDTTWADDGTYSLKAVASDPASNDSYIRTGLTDAATDNVGGLTFFQPNKTYVAQATVRLKSKLRGIQNVRARRLSVFWRNSVAGGSYPGLSGAQFPNEPGTYRPTIPFTTPADVDQAFFRVNLGVARYTRTNYCTNPSFETGVTGWIAPTGVALTSVTASTLQQPFLKGSKVGRITYTSASLGAYVYAQNTVPAAGEGKWLYFGIGARPSTSSKYARIIVEGRATTTTDPVLVTAETRVELVQTGTDMRYGVKVQIPAGVTVGHVRVLFRLYGDAAYTTPPQNGVLDIDAADFGVADLEEDAQDFIYDYADGAQTDNDAWDYAWTSVAHASTTTAIARNEIYVDNVTAVEGTIPRQFNGGTKWTNLLPTPRDAGFSWITNGATGTQTFVSTGGPRNVGYKEFRMTTGTSDGTTFGLRVSPQGATAPKVNGGEEYTFSTYSFLQPALDAGVTVARVGIAVEWLDVLGNIVQETSSYITASKAAWQRVSMVYTAPGTAVRAQMRVIYQAVGGFNGGTLAQVSANMMERGVELRTYYEGSRSYTDNAMMRRFLVSWAGAVNASQSILTEQITPGATTPFSWVNSFARWVITNPRTAGAGLWYGHEAEYRSPMSGAAGDKAEVAVWMRCSIDCTMVLQAYLYDAAGTSVGVTAATTVALAAGQWTELRDSTGPASAAFESVGFLVTSSTPMPADVLYDITALNQEFDTAGAYFDGDMPDTTRIANEWESGANASASIQANASTQAYTVDDPSFSPISLAEDLYVDETSTTSLVSAFEESNRGGRAVTLNIPMNFAMYDDVNVRGLLSSAFSWLDTFEVMTEWETQIGEFMIDRISEAHFPYDVTISGRDYTKKCIKSKFLHATQFGPGMPLEQLIDSIAGAAGVVKRSLPTTGVTIDREFFFDRGVTRWEAIKEIATAYNHEVFFDAQGYLTVRPFRDPALGSPLITISTGPDGNLASYAKSTSDTEIYNVILVTGESSDSETPPVWAVASNNNPDSPTAIDKIGERVFEYSSSFITTTAQAQALANSYLAIYALEENELSFDVLMMPWLEVGDILGFADPRPAPGDPTNFLLTNLSIPLALGPMSGTGRRVVIVG